MKKIVFTLAALMTMTVAFAEGETSTKTEAAAIEAKYDVNVNMSSLSRALRLNTDDARTVAFVEGEFRRDMQKAATADSEERDKLVKKAVNRNLGNMRSILDADQYHVYVQLLNATLNNRGIINK